MTDAQCTVPDCDEPAPASYLCGRHDWELERNLAALPALLTELDTTRSRTDRIAIVGNRAHRPVGHISDVACWCGCTLVDSAHHLPAHGHPFEQATRETDRGHARPDLGSFSALPVSDTGADAYVRAENTLVTWTQHLVETRGATLREGVLPKPATVGPTCSTLARCYHPSCAAIHAMHRAPAAQPPLAVLALWLLANSPPSGSTKPPANCTTTSSPSDATSATSSTAPPTACTPDPATPRP